ncbi:MAG: hypothetical protein ABEJ43_11225 [Haloferacaceae archaeon]
MTPEGLVLDVDDWANRHDCPECGADWDADKRNGRVYCTDCGSDVTPTVTGKP